MKISYAEARGTISDINEKLAGEDASQYLEHLKAVGRGENPFPPKMVLVPGKATWESRGALIYITLPPSEGVTGPQWIEDFNGDYAKPSYEAESVLRSEDFKPTVPGFVHKIVALKSTFWKNDFERTTKAIEAEGITRKWLKTHLEATCIFRKCFSDKQIQKMGLQWIVGIHKPIVVDHYFRFLSVELGGSLRTFSDRLDGLLNDRGAFFWSLPEVPQS